MPKVRMPCLRAHDWYPGLKAKFVGPDTNLLEDFELRTIDLPDTQITFIADKNFEKALHFHEVEVEE